MYATILMFFGKSHPKFPPKIDGFRISDGSLNQIRGKGLSWIKWLTNANEDVHGFKPSVCWMKSVHSPRSAFYWPLRNLGKKFHEKISTQNLRGGGLQFKIAFKIEWLYRLYKANHFQEQIAHLWIFGFGTPYFISFLTTKVFSFLLLKEGDGCVPFGWCMATCHEYLRGGVEWWTSTRAKEAWQRNTTNHQ